MNSALPENCVKQTLKRDGVDATKLRELFVRKNWNNQNSLPKKDPEILSILHRKHAEINYYAITQLRPFFKLTNRRTTFTY